VCVRASNCVGKRRFIRASLKWKCIPATPFGTFALTLAVHSSESTALSTRGAAHHSTGPNLNRLFIGAEGCLGIVTEATLRVFPQPEKRELMAYTFAEELTRLHYDFELWARDDQLPPEAAQGGGAWTIWLMLGGRGAGKTRAGAEWASMSASRV